MVFGKKLLGFFTQKQVQIWGVWLFSLAVAIITASVLLRSNFLRNELKSNIVIKSQLTRLGDKLQSFQYQIAYIGSQSPSNGSDSLIRHYWHDLKFFSRELEEALILSNKYQVEHFQEKYPPKISSLKKHILEYQLSNVSKKSDIQVITKDLNDLYAQIVETSAMITTAQRQVSLELNDLWSVSTNILIAFCVFLVIFPFVFYKKIKSIAKKNYLVEQLHKSETKLLESQQLAKVGSWDIDLLTGECSFSEQFFVLSEAYTPDDRQPFYQDILQNSHNPFWKHIHAEDVGFVQETVQKALGTHTDFDIEYRVIGSTGKVKYFRNVAKFTKNQQGKYLKLSGTIQDITTYKSLANKLHTNNYLIQGILEGTQEQIFALDVQFNYIAFNQTHMKFMKMFIPKNIEVGECMLDYIPYPEIQRYLEEKIRVVLSGKTITNEYEKITNITAENGYIHIQYSSYPIYKQQNKIRGVAVFVSNITQQVNAEIEKKRHEEKYARLVENMTEGVVYFDKSAKIIFANPSFYELIQISTNPTLFDDFAQVFTQDSDKEQFRSLIAQTLSGSRVHLEAAITALPNQFSWIRMISVPLHNADSEINGFMITITDLTKHKELEDALSKSEQRLRYILENTQTMIVIHDPQGYLLETNKVFFDNFQYVKEDLIGKRISTFMPSRHQRYLELYLKEIVAQKICKGHIVIYDKEGNKRILAYQNVYVEADPPYIIGSAVEVTQEIQDRKEIERQKALIQQIISISPNLIFVKNQRLEYLLVNQSFANFFHKNMEDIVGTTDDALVKESHLVSFYENMDAECLKDPYQLHTSEHSLIHDGQEKRFFFTKMSFLSNNEQLILGISTDITQQYQYQKKIEEMNNILKNNNIELNLALDKLQEANEKLSQTMRIKDEFMANMSHEIRTPLNAIIGFAELLQKTELSKEQFQYIHIAHQASEKLLQIINDLLDYNKLESGKITLHPIEFIVKDAVTFLKELFEFRFKEKRLVFELKYSPEVPVVLIGDINRLHQVLINLLGNACKFTLQGAVTLSVGVEKLQEQDCWLYFEVTDTGIGIPEDKLHKIFERFEQVSSGLSRNFEGTGLGLSITKSLVSLMNGTITVKSTLGKGSTFRIIIPFTIPTVNNLRSVSLEKPIEIPNKTLDILVVEDNPINQILTKKVLERLNHTVTIAENGAVAIQKLQENQYDIILLDIQMPVMDGYQTIEKIRNDLKLSIPVIALTAHTLEEEKEKCLRAGFNSYVTKPFKPSDLQVLIVSLWLQHKQDKNWVKN